jgi:arylsulfatase A-like enzyme
MDTARAKSCSAYGYDRDTTPFLEKCAEQGFKFENAIANSLWTYPSHVSMFTGMYPHEHERISKYDRGEILFDSFIEELSEEGYETTGLSSNAWVSNMFGFEGLFDNFSLLTGTYLFDEAPLMKDFKKRADTGEWNSSWDRYTDFILRAVRERRLKSIANGAYFVINNKILDRFFPDKFWKDYGAKKVLRRIKRIELDSDQPNFVFVNFIEPHDRYAPPRDFAEKFYQGDIDSERKLLDTQPVDFLGQTDENKAEVLQKFYDASINYLDYMLENIHDYIEENTERDNIFIFVGDHGEMFDSDGLWGHFGGFQREVLRVPLIVKGHEQGYEEEIFELKDMKDLVWTIIEDGEINFGTEEAYSDYLGLESHMYNDDIPEGYNEPKVARITLEDMEVVSSLSNSGGRLKEHLRGLKMKKNRNDKLK